MLLATVLDPRFKISCFESASVADEVKDLLKERSYEAAIEWVRENAQDAMSSNESEPDEPSSSIMKLLFMDDSTSSPVKKKQRSGLPGSVDARQKANVEVETYLSSKLVTKDKFSPYKYWKEHRVEFPVLRSLAQCYLTAPSTTAESERMFSTGIVIYNHLRQSMTGATFQKLLLLSRNIPIYDSLDETPKNLNAGRFSHDRDRDRDQNTETSRSRSRRLDRDPQPWRPSERIDVNLRYLVGSIVDVLHQLNE